MTTPEKKDNKAGNFRMQVSIKRPKRFKAGAEIGNAVELSMDVSEEETDREQHLSVHLQLREGTGPCN